MVFLVESLVERLGVQEAVGEVEADVVESVCANKKHRDLLHGWKGLARQRHPQGSVFSINQDVRSTSSEAHRQKR